MEGISKDKLREILVSCIRNKVWPGMWVLDECKELNPWMPIETAPKGRKIRLLFPESRDKEFKREVIESSYNVDSAKVCWERLPSFWQEITPDPKT